MNATVRKILTANSLSRRVYFAARQAYGSRRMARGVERCFVNADEFRSALGTRGGTALVDLRTVDGLTITMRQNRGDASTLAMAGSTEKEQFQEVTEKGEPVETPAPRMHATETG